MTTIQEKSVRCAVCGSLGKCYILTSSFTFGSADLDTRPPPLLRSTMFIFVQQCQTCGYCAQDLSAERQGVRAVVASTCYKEQLSDPRFPKEANWFLCAGIIDEQCGDLAGAAWARIHAAWVCDDSGECPQAELCRSKAAETIIKARERGQSISAQDGADVAILVDLLRRSNQFDKAQAVIESRLNGIQDDIVRKVMEYQTRLVQERDASTHLLSEALQGADVGL